MQSMVMIRVGDQHIGLGVQLWACANCGHLWHRSGAIDQKMNKKK